MKNLYGLALLFFSVLAFSFTCAADSRESMSLDGAWSFKLDSKGTGENENWFSATPVFVDEIVVPGAWDAQGFGEETEKLHHNYVGKGWYKKEVAIPPDWQGKQVFICFGGVYRYAKVWVNGVFLGEHIGYVSDFEYDITKNVSPGEKILIAIQIDSEQRWDIDALQGCLDIIDHLYTYWGGIWGHVTLEARAQGWLQDLFVKPQAAPTGCSVSATLAGNKSLVEEVRLEILSEKGKVVVSDTKKIGEVLGDKDELTITAGIPDAQLWTPDMPYLYTARLSLLQQGKVLDHQETSVGLRTIEIRDTDFYLNGKKIYLNGYGDDCVYPETICPPSDKDYYLKHLRVAKSYGFNYVRHHSHFVTPEYYAACDEVGMLVSPELPIGYPRFYARAGAAAQELYKAEWISAIKRYRNHPSIFDWCMGNEEWEGISIGPELYRVAKELDPTRPVIDTDGVFAPGFVDGKRDRPTMDFYTAMFDILTTPLDNPSKFKTGKPKKPVITHEEGNYVTFPRLDQIALFKHDFKPFWLTPVKERIEKAGLFNEVPRWAENSERLYYLCHKENIEALRKNPYISGYHWWLLKPWYPGSNGLIDIYDRPTSLKPEQIRQINGPVVILQDGLARTYRSGQSLELALSVSNYSGVDFTDVQVVCSIKDTKATFARQTLNVVRASHGEITALGTVKSILADVQTPCPLRIEVTLDAGGKHYTNEWPTWVYPADTTLSSPKTSPQTALYVSADLMGTLAGYQPRVIPETGVLSGAAVYIARQPSMALLEAAAAGSCVVLLSPVGVFPTDSTSYKSAWWLGVFDGDSNAGTMVYDNPVTNAIAPEGWCDASWLHLLQGAQTVLLDGLPAQPHVLIRALNTHSAPHGFSRYVDFEYMWRNKSLLFETKVGNGALIVSGLNFDVALRRGGPEGPCLLSRLIAYAGTLPKPEAEIPLDYLRKKIDDSPFTKGPVVSGFERLDYFKGDTASVVSYREPDTPLYKVHQEEATQRIEWQTAPAPQTDRTIFIFAGGLPFKDPPLVNPGFTLTVNGQRVLDFDTTKTERLWLSDDKGCALLYVPSPSRPSWNDTMGLFYVSVPGNLLRPGEPCRLGVRTRGGEFSRWFGLNPYTDVLTPGTTPAAAVK